SVLASNAARIMDQGRALRAAYPGAAFDFVVGFDTLVRVFEPRYYDDMVRELNPFFRDHRLIATNRGELSVEDVEEFLNRNIVRDFAERIVVCEIPDDCA